MAGVPEKISQLPPLPQQLVAGGNIVPVTAAGATYKATFSQIAFQSQSTWLASDVLLPGVGAGAANSAALQALWETIKATGQSATILFTGSYYFDATVTFDLANRLLLLSQSDGEVIAGPDMGQDAPIFNFVGPGIVANTTLSASISAGTQVIPVASTAGIQPGDYIVLTSTARSGFSTNGEYWNGITGVSGYEYTPKSEMLIVQSVDSSTQLTSSWVTVDSYDAVDYIVTVSVSQFSQDVGIQGLRITGTGQEGSEIRTGPIGFQFRYIANAFVRQCTFSNWNENEGNFILCERVGFIDNDQIGRNLADPSNLPAPADEWMQGVSFIGCYIFTYADNRVRGMRVPFEIGSGDSSTISRGGLIANNNVWDAGFSAHQCQYVSYIGNRLNDCRSGGFYFRGKDAVFVGNYLRPTQGSTSSSAILLGNVTGSSYTETPSSGSITIDSNDIEGFIAGVSARVALDRMSAYGNTFNKITSHAFHISGKTAQNIYIGPNDAQNTSGSTTHSGVFIENQSINPLTALTDVVIDGLNCIGFGTAVQIMGTAASSAPADRIRIHVGNSYGGAVSQMLACIYLTGGFFGPHVVIEGYNQIGAPLHGDVWIDNPQQVYTYPPIRGRLSSSSHTELVAVQGSALLPNFSNVEQGQTIQNSTAAPGLPTGWVCTNPAGGTFGVLSGVTGAIAASTTALTLSANPNSQVQPGAFLNVAGAGVAGAALQARVTALSGLLATLNVPASTTVSAATTTYVAPVMTTIGTLPSTTAYVPADTPGLLDWWNVDDPSKFSLSGASVLTWTGVNGNVWTSVVDPTYSSTGWDVSTPAVTFNGVSGGAYMTCPLFSAAGTIIIVAQRGTQSSSSGTTNRTMLLACQSNGGPIAHLYVNRPAEEPAQTQINMAGFGTGAVASRQTNFGTGSKAVILGSYNAAGTNCAEYTDGQPPTAAGALGASTGTAMELGANSFNVAADRAAMTITDVLFYNSQLSSFEIQRITGYLAWHRGIQASLWSGSPYLTAPPMV